MTRCSIVIRSFNEERHIGRLLQGVACQAFGDVQTIVVDSGSTDRTVEIAAAAGAQIVHIRPEAFTFGYSLNQGIAAAAGEFIVIASAHVYPVYSDWLERLLAPFADPQIGLAYGKQRGSAASKFSEQQVFAHWYPDHSDPRQPHPFCNNANAAIRRSLWEKRPYDETLPGLEDLAWARWMMEQGLAIAYVAEAEIIHVHDETPRAVYNRYRREAMAFKRLFPDEHFHWWSFLRLAGGNIVSDLWHAARQGMWRKSWRSIFWFRLAQFWGTYRGYRQSGPLTWQLRQTFYYPRGVRRAQAARREANPIQYTEK